jgi:hypothetical protein
MVFLLLMIVIPLSANTHAYFMQKHFPSPCKDYRVQKQMHKKSNPLWIKIVIFLAKIPLLILLAGLDTVATKAPEPESFLDRYKRDPSILDGFPPARHRYPSEHE